MVWLAQGGHDHGTSVPALLGPLVLLVVLYHVLPVVVGYAVLSVVAPAPGRRTALAVTVASVVAFVLHLLLADDVGFPPRVAVLLLVCASAPLVLCWRAPESVVARVRPFAPWPAAGALVMAALAWSARAEPALATANVHAALLCACAGVSWLALCERTPRWHGLAVRVPAVVLALLLVAGTAHATLQRSAVEDRPASGANGAARVR